MESKNIQRVTFAELADTKLVLVLLSADADQKYRAYRMLVQMGQRLNSAAMAEARRDNIATLELLLSVATEFRRLHVDCPCSTTPEEVEEGIKQIRERLDSVKADDASAGPIDTDPNHAAEDLVNFLSATGMEIPEGFDPRSLPGLRAGNDPYDGTGLYL